MMEFVDQMKVKLADFFCDDMATFNLEECILTFKIFCEKFKKAIEVRNVKIHYQFIYYTKSNQKQIATYRKVYALLDL